jgi:hypothetical protein
LRKDARDVADERFLHVRSRCRRRAPTNARTKTYTAEAAEHAESISVSGPRRSAVTVLLPTKC